MYTYSLKHRSFKYGETRACKIGALETQRALVLNVTLKGATLNLSLPFPSVKIYLMYRVLFCTMQYITTFRVSFFFRGVRAGALPILFQEKRDKEFLQTSRLQGSWDPPSDRAGYNLQSINISLLTCMYFLSVTITVQILQKATLPISHSFMRELWIPRADSKFLEVSHTCLSPNLMPDNILYSPDQQFGNLSV